MKIFINFIELILLVLIFFSCENKTSNEIIFIDANSSQLMIKQGLLIEVSVQELLTMLKYDKNAFVIDVRKPDKSIRSCKLIEGYKHIEDSLVYKNPTLLPKERSIVLLSKTGERSRLLGQFLKDKGMTVYNLQDGMDSYWKSREKLIREKLHIYDDQIDVIELYADDFGC